MTYTYIIYNIIKEQRSNKKCNKQRFLISLFNICINFLINIHKCSYIFYIYLNQFMIYYIISRSNSQIFAPLISFVFLNLIFNLILPWLILLWMSFIIFLYTSFDLLSFLFLLYHSFFSFSSTTLRKIVFWAWITEHIEIHCVSSLSISILVSQQHYSHALRSDTKRQT